MKKHGEVNNVEASFDERYNVSDTKKYYSKINERVLEDEVLQLSMPSKTKTAYRFHIERTYLNI